MAHSLEIKAVPSSGRSECIIDRVGNIKCYLKSAPERGAANTELIKLIAKKLRIAQQDVEIVAGASSRKKILRVNTDMEKEAMMRALGLYRQMTIF